MADLDLAQAGGYGGHVKPVSSRLSGIITSPGKLSPQVKHISSLLHEFLPMSTLVAKSLPTSRHARTEIQITVRS